MAETEDGKNFTYFKLHSFNTIVLHDHLQHVSLQRLDSIRNARSTLELLSKETNLDEIMQSILLEQMKIPDDLGLRTEWGLTKASPVWLLTSIVISNAYKGITLSMTMIPGKIALLESFNELTEFQLFSKSKCELEYPRSNPLFYHCTEFGRYCWVEKSVFNPKPDEFYISISTSPKPIALHPAYIFYILSNSADEFELKFYMLEKLVTFAFLKLPYIIKYPEFRLHSEKAFVIESNCESIIFACKYCEQKYNPYAFKFETTQCQPRKYRRDMQKLYIAETEDGKNFTYFKENEFDTLKFGNNLKDLDLERLVAISNARTTLDVLHKVMNLDEIILSVLLEKMRKPDSSSRLAVEWKTARASPSMRRRLP
ncbi:unnamed protein product [Orchesella dallaii]|uniref:Uncharacterized protein n=1 Tax=Orchesella dallaii TaxID=48710 RepID=A0ABP1S812_9HEXA